MPRSSTQRSVSAFALCALTVLDLVLIWAALAFPFGALVFAVLLLARAALSAAGAFVHLLGAPPQVLGAKRYFLIIASLFHFFVPAVSFIGVSLVLHLGLSAERKVAPAGFVSFAFEGDLMSRKPAPNLRTITAQGLEEVLRSASASPDKRFQAVLQTRYLAPKQAIAVLKLALKDTSDEVRLYAFSRLERFRNDLEIQSRELSEKLSGADAQARPLLHLRLAETYWEIAYLGLAEGAVREHALKSAQDNADTACKLRPGSAPAEFLSGRVSLVQKKYEDAFGAFDRAVRAGYTRLKALPYMAECAFHQQRYDEVRAMLHEVAASGQEAVGFQSVVEFWR